MSKNNYLQRQRMAQQFNLNIGLQYGRQQIIDMMSLVLRDPTIMGKDIFGKDRLMKIVNGIGEYIDKRSEEHTV